MQCTQACDLNQCLAKRLTPNYKDLVLITTAFERDLASKGFGISIRVYTLGPLVAIVINDMESAHAGPILRKSCNVYQGAKRTKEQMDVADSLAINSNVHHIDHAADLKSQCAIDTAIS